MQGKNIKCKKCKGTGWVCRVYGMRGLRLCPVCKGRGEVMEIPCFTDDAEGTGEAKVRNVSDV
jgi:DnaJ-class molecular chaperone